MSSPSKIKRADKQNAFQITLDSSRKNSLNKVSQLSPTKCFFQSPMKKKNKQTIMELYIILDGLKPMDINTSFDQQVPQNQKQQLCKQCKHFHL